MKEVLVTGASGVIGSALVRELERAGFQQHLLLRAKTDAELADRGRTFVTTAMLYRGDVARPRLGLNNKQWAELSSRLTHIIHVAGDVRMNLTLNDARNAAVLPLREIARLAEDCHRHGRFEKLDVVSTVGVAGRATAEVREAPVPRPRGFHNSYEQAKWEAERFILEWRQHGIPMTIHRPSMVIETTHNSSPAHQVFFHLCEFLCGLRTRGIVPEVGGLFLDLVSVSYAAKAIQLSSQTPAAAGRIFHLASGKRAIPLSKLIREGRRHFAQVGRPLPRLQFLERREFRRRLPGLSRSHPEHAAFFGALHLLLDYMNKTPRFENDATDSFFRGYGLVGEAPNVLLSSAFSSYWPIHRPSLGTL